MAKKLEFLDIVLDKARYFAGDRVEGEVQISLKEAIKVGNAVVQFKGDGSTSWMNKTSEKVFSVKQLYLDQSIVLGEQLDRICSAGFGQKDSEPTLPRGKHTLRFSLVLPKNLPSSFVGEYGSIRYMCTAYLERGHKSRAALRNIGTHHDFTAEKKFSVFALVDLATHWFTQHPTELQEEESATCCCITKGTVNAKLRLAKTGYVAGEKIRVDVEVSNHSPGTTINKVAAKLLQNVQFYGQSDFLESEEMKNLRFLMDAKNRGPVSPGTDRTWSDIELNTTDLVPTQSGYAVNVNYTLRLEVENGPIIDSPILIATTNSNASSSAQ